MTLSLSGSADLPAQTMPSLASLFCLPVCDISTLSDAVLYSPPPVLLDSDQIAQSPSGVLAVQVEPQ